GCETRRGTSARSSAPLSSSGSTVRAPARGGDISTPFMVGASSALLPVSRPEIAQRLKYFSHSARLVKRGAFSSSSALALAKAFLHSAAERLRPLEHDPSV